MRLPEQASLEKVEATVAAAISQLGEKANMGSVIRAAKQELGASVDGRALADAVRAALASRS